MLLDVFRELGIAWSPYTYGDEEDGSEPSAGTAVLDEIDCAGCANRKSLLAAAHQFGYPAFILIFTVPKAAGKLRLIFDCRPVNRLCRRSPPVNLPSIAEVVEKARGCKCMILGDLRHYFHQIGLPENAKKYSLPMCRLCLCRLRQLWNLLRC